MALLDELQVFYGQTNANQSRVYARLNVDDGGTDLSLTGFVRGPFCEFSQTLPVTVSLTSSGGGEGLLAGAAILDPCFWSPDLPVLYQVHVELRRAGAIVETDDRQLGIRVFGPRGRSLFLNGQRWVPRCVTHGGSIDGGVLSYREHAASIYVDDPNDDVLRDASRSGVMCVVDITRIGGDLPARLNELSRWASVAIVVAENIDSASRATAPNVLFAQRVMPDGEFAIADWADLVIGVVSDPALFARRLADCELPVLAMRRYDETSSVVGTRAACDRLQRDLAPFADFAGYIV